MQCANAGWHMDPFGNSGITPLLFDGYGFDSHVTCAGRLPQIRLGRCGTQPPHDCRLLPPPTNQNVSPRLHQLESGGAASGNQGTAHLCARSATAGQTRWHWQQQLQNVWTSSGGASVFQHIIEGMCTHEFAIPPPSRDDCFGSRSSPASRLASRMTLLPRETL